MRSGTGQRPGRTREGHYEAAERCLRVRVTSSPWRGSTRPNVKTWR